MTNILGKFSDFLIKQFACIYYAQTAIECIEDVIKNDLPLNIRRMKANIFLSTLDKIYYHLSNTEVV